MARVKFIRRRSDEPSQLRPSAPARNRPLAPAQPSSSAQNLDPNIDPRLQDVNVHPGTFGDDSLVSQGTTINPSVSRGAAEPSQQSAAQLGGADPNLVAAVSGLLLLGGANPSQATAPQVTAPQAQPRPRRANDIFPNIIQPPAVPNPDPDFGGPRINSTSKRVKRDTGESKKPTLSVEQLSMQSFKNNCRLDARRGTPQFNIFQAILQHAHIFFHFITCLDIDELVTLYAISKDLHNVVNTATTAIMLSQAMRYASDAATVFPFRCYRRLCNDDSRVELDQTRGQSRLIPSFRWLRMVRYREEVAQKIITMLNDEGLYLPGHCATIVKKVWFLMDIPDNQRRVAIIQNEDLWSASDLFYAIMLFMRIDMRCTDPLAKRAYGHMRRMLIAQPSMTMLCRVLERKFLINRVETVQTWLRWKYEPRNNDPADFYGMPLAELGLLQYEGYGKDGRHVKLLRPDDLILKECVRRGMDMEPAFFCILNCTGPRPEPVVDDDDTMSLDEADK
ncbi:conserved hypothetical protein [Talaromyces stipitatus ATCC 10500]|uniref:Uncharacterized protein n=1 Tax=Talaromyces stipitatus (strain ATCC 10500 / CBS 375.48 / QM 6759 / NRRL 1006) TaxID=441959 RepID=B8MDF2_TALSN|nr:uncharacterized protein TSTA_117010 [Talaromyces stipitatus ATCC 10500]EED17915.1 conserved hypothetical protein [Talaromyces stipitatus ATCC 10500]